MFCIHIVYRGIRILHELFVNASSISLCVWFFIHIGYRVSWFFLSCLYVILNHNFLCVFFIHIGYRGIIILHELSQCDSSNFLWVWLCILNGYRGITILCELSYMILQFRFMCDFVFTLVICIMILCELSLWFFNFALCFCIHIDYRGILFLHEMSQCDSSNSLCVWFFILISYRGIMILHELSLCDSSTTLCVWFCIHIGYRGYHDSSNSVLATLCLLYKFTAKYSQVQKGGWNKYPIKGI